jgi:Trypsin-like peptidase domain
MKRILPFVFLISISISCLSQQNGNKKLSNAELLINSTVRLECERPFIDASGQWKIKTSVGTGFFYNLKIDTLFYTVIITNRHVIKGYSKLTIKLKRTLVDGTPNYGRNETIIIDKFQDRAIYHPDTSVDLAIISIGDVLNDYKARNIPLINVPFDESIIPSDSIFKKLGSLEDVFMIGYPNGIYDTINNLPVARKGITATPQSIKYNNKSEFLVDISDVSGSSGSPIVLYNPISLNEGGISFGTRLYLIGINYGVYLSNYEGEIVKENVPDSSSVKTKTWVPINIALIIRADKILDFKDPFRKKFGIK